MSQTSDILFDKSGCAGVITLNKPDTLNAVTDQMLTALNQQLDDWENDEAVKRVIIKAVPGRAFSAGGDIRHLYDCGVKGDFDFDFFAREYVLNARIANFSKPYIALIDGIAMGGGVGVSFHGSHRFVGENMSFAMPEVGIGFFPDVGASYFLSRLPGKLGLYLGLTGQRLKWGDALLCGLATNAVRSEDFEKLEKSLCGGDSIEQVVDQYAAHPVSEWVKSKETKINDYFSEPTLNDIVNRLEKDAPTDDWAAATLKLLKGKAPLSLEIAFRQINEGGALSIEECMKMEYRILKRILTAPDFYEGIRAAIIDKDNNPNWQPNALVEVEPAAVDKHFDTLGDEELQFS